MSCGHTATIVSVLRRMVLGDPVALVALCISLYPHLIATGLGVSNMSIDETGLLILISVVLIWGDMVCDRRDATSVTVAPVASWAVWTNCPMYVVLFISRVASSASIWPKVQLLCKVCALSAASHCYIQPLHHFLDDTVRLANIACSVARTVPSHAAAQPIRGCSNVLQTPAFHQRGKYTPGNALHTR